MFRPDEAANVDWESVWFGLDWQSSTLMSPTRLEWKIDDELSNPHFIVKNFQIDEIKKEGDILFSHYER